jgi:hypothetical protein
MNEYIDNLEMQIEQLKLALEKEREWNDFTEKRRKNKLNRIWCLSINSKPKDLKHPKSVNLRMMYDESIFYHIEDMRSYFRSYIYDCFEHWSNHLLHSDECEGKDSFVQIDICFELFDREKDKAFFICRIKLILGLNKEKKNCIIKECKGISPGQINVFDEELLYFFEDDDDYVKKWNKMKYGETNNG